jgi:hypothetical protein
MKPSNLPRTLRLISVCPHAAQPQGRSDTDHLRSRYGNTLLKPVASLLKWVVQPDAVMTLWRRLGNWGWAMAFYTDAVSDAWGAANGRAIERRRRAPSVTSYSFRELVSHLMMFRTVQEGAERDREISRCKSR